MSRIFRGRSSLSANGNETFGPVEHLVHAAAIGSGKFGFPFTNLTPADWPRVLEVNIVGMVNIAHAVAPLLVERRRGTLVFIASVAGQIGSPTDPPYSASKAANINFAQCLARDLAVAWHSGEYGLSGNGADAAERIGLASLARSPAARKSQIVRGMGRREDQGNGSSGPLAAPGGHRRHGGLSIVGAGCPSHRPNNQC